MNKYKNILRYPKFQLYIKTQSKNDLIIIKYINPKYLKLTEKLWGTNENNFLLSLVSQFPIKSNKLQNKTIYNIQIIYFCFYVDTTVVNLLIK